MVLVVCSLVITTYVVAKYFYDPPWTRERFSTAEWEELLAETRLLSPSEQPPSKSVGHDVDPLYHTISIKNLLGNYTELHYDILHGFRKKKKFLVVHQFNGNIGNRMLTLLGYLLLAMRLERALVIDDDNVFYDLYDLPIETRISSVPEPFRGRIESFIKKDLRDDLEWMPHEIAVCMPFLPEARDEKALFFAPSQLDDDESTGFDGMEKQHYDDFDTSVMIQRRNGGISPHTLVLNPHMRNWYRSNIAGHLSVVSRWFLRFHSKWTERAVEIEHHICGGRPCDVAIHVRRGRMKDQDLYFHNDRAGHELRLAFECLRSVIITTNPDSRLTRVFMAVDQPFVLDLARKAFQQIRNIQIVSQEDHDGEEKTGRGPDGTMESAIVDMIIASHSPNFIGTRGSTFSSVVAAMNDNDYYHLIGGSLEQQEQCTRVSSCYAGYMQFGSHSLVQKFDLESSMKSQCFEEDMLQMALDMFGLSE